VEDPTFNSPREAPLQENKECEDRKKGLPTLSVGVVSFISRAFPSHQSESSGDHHPSPVSLGKRLFLSLRIMLHRLAIVEASIGTVLLSRPIPGSSPSHFIMTGGVPAVS
jgi:hypothetical protein